MAAEVARHVFPDAALGLSGLCQVGADAIEECQHFVALAPI